MAINEMFDEMRSLDGVGNQSAYLSAGKVLNQNGKSYFVNADGSVIDLNKPLPESEACIFDNRNIMRDEDGNEIDADIATILRLQQREQAEFEMRKNQADESEVKLYDFRHLAPMRREMAIQDFAYPHLKELAEEVEKACDAVEHIEQHKTVKMLGYQAEFGATLMNKKRLRFESIYFYNLALKNKELEIEGYYVKDVVSGAGGRSIYVVMWPVGFECEADFAKTPDAIAYAEQKYSSELEQANLNRKRTQVKLVDFKKQVAQELKLIDDDKKLFKA